MPPNGLCCYKFALLEWGRLEPLRFTTKHQRLALIRYFSLDVVILIYLATCDRCILYGNLGNGWNVAVATIFKCNKIILNYMGLADEVKLLHLSLKSYRHFFQNAYGLNYWSSGVLSRSCCSENECILLISISIRWHK